jgi:hypothetical protein
MLDHLVETARSVVDMSQPWGKHAFRGAEFDWAKMLERLSGVVGSLARRKGG